MSSRLHLLSNTGSVEALLITGWTDRDLWDNHCILFPAPHRCRLPIFSVCTDGPTHPLILFSLSLNHANIIWFPDTDKSSIFKISNILMNKTKLSSVLWTKIQACTLCTKVMFIGIKWLDLYSQRKGVMHISYIISYIIIISSYWGHIKLKLWGTSLCCRIFLAVIISDCQKSFFLLWNPSPLLCQELPGSCGQVRNLHEVPWVLLQSRSSLLQDPLALLLLPQSPQLGGRRTGADSCYWCRNWLAYRQPRGWEKVFLGNIKDKTKYQASPTPFLLPWIEKRRYLILSYDWIHLQMASFFFSLVSLF